MVTSTNYSEQNTSPSIPAFSPDRIPDCLNVLASRIGILENVLRYLQDRSLWIANESTARMIDMTGSEYDILPGAQSDYRFQVFNTFCAEIGPLAYEEGVQFEENGEVFSLEDIHPPKAEHSSDEQMEKAMVRLAEEYRQLCSVAEAKGLNRIGHSHRAVRKELLYSGTYYSREDAARAAAAIMSRNPI